MHLTKKTKLAIILPALNEARVIGSVLDGLPKTIRHINHTYQTSIIVVNDGSTDDTAKEVTKRKHVQLINHILTSGAGAATRTGLSYAKNMGYQFVLTMDSDGQHAPEDVVKLAKAIFANEADLIIGSRLLRSKGMPLYRVLGNKGLSLITFLIFGVFVTDSQSGMKALNKTAMDKITFHSNNFAFCSEMLWKANQEKLRIKEVPIKAIYTDYSLKKGQNNWGAVHIIRQLIKRRIMGFVNG